MTTGADKILADLAAADAELGGETVVPIDPLIKLLHTKFAYSSSYTTNDEKAAAKEQMLRDVTENNMQAYYEILCDLFGWGRDDKILAAMTAANTEALKKIDERIADAKENLGDSEVREALLKKAEFYCRTGDLQNAIAAIGDCNAKTLAPGPKLDLCFTRIRLGLAFSDNDVAAKGITDAHALMKDGDWERRNRLKVYEGLYSVCVRDFEKGSKLLLESLSTFASTELMDYKEFVFVTVVSALVTLKRKDLKTKVVEAPEVLSAGLGDTTDLVNAIYQCKYREVFATLDRVCNHLRHSVYLTLHVNYFFREVRVIVFNQFLDSYSSVTLTSMANSFNLPVMVLDSMLCTLISNERIACKIDRVSGNVTTYRGDNINFQYHRLVKEGDILLTRIQKLSRLVEM